MSVRVSRHIYNAVLGRGCLLFRSRVRHCVSAMPSPFRSCISTPSCVLSHSALDLTLFPPLRPSSALSPSYFSSLAASGTGDGDAGRNFQTLSQLEKWMRRLR